MGRRNDKNSLTPEEERILEKLEADRVILDEVFEEMEANRERYEAEYAAARAEFEEGEKKTKKTAECGCYGA